MMFPKLKINRFGIAMAYFWKDVQLESAMGVTIIIVHHRLLTWWTGTHACLEMPHQMDPRIANFLLPWIFFETLKVLHAAQRKVQIQAFESSVEYRTGNQCQHDVTLSQHIEMLKKELTDGKNKIERLNWNGWKHLTQLSLVPKLYRPYVYTDSIHIKFQTQPNSYHLLVKGNTSF